ncbi:MAG: nucleotidyltransferase family protein [Phycisphaerales bacterium]
MIPLVKDNLGAIAELCVKHGVHRLELFGSAACGDFDPERSDIEFLVEFADKSYKGMADRYFGLLFGLEAVFNRRIDLATVSSLKNPYVLKSVNETKVPVYAAA